jgi:hypothetical protein
VDGEKPVCGNGEAKSLSESVSFLALTLKLVTNTFSVTDSLPQMRNMEEEEKWLLGFRKFCH